MVSNVVQVLFNMSDIAVVGRFAGSTALGAVGSTATLVTLFTGFLMGVGNGVNALTARFFGARDEENLQKTVSAWRCCLPAAGRRYRARRAAPSAARS
ncbi:MAG: MATE family efflux transporter [Oscillospiraceae bacterium]